MVVAALLDRLSTFTQQERIVGAVVARAMMGNGRKPQDEIVADLCRAGKLSLRQQIAVALTLVETNDPEWKLEGGTNAGADEEDAGRAETEDQEQAHKPASVPVATILQELGYACGRKTDLVQVLGLFAPLDETSVSQILGMMCRTLVGLDVAPGVYASFCSANGLPDPVDEPATTWDPTAVVQAVQSVNPDLNWETVLSNLDHKDFWVPDSASFLWLVHACDLARPGETFPLETVLGRIWNNKRGQVTFLKYAVDAPADVFTFAHSQRLAPPLEGIAGGKSPIGTSNFAWLCLELLETLIALADSGQMLVVRSVLEKPLQMCPEVLAVSMAVVNTWGTLKHEVMAATVPSFVLGANASSSLVLHRLWSCCRNILVSTMVELYMKDRSIISRILDVCQELKCLPEVLAMSPYIFAIELACLATRREYLNLEKWLQDMIAKEGTVFVQCCVRFLADKLQADASVPKPPAIVTLPPETMAMFVQVLQGQSAGFPPEILQEIKQISELMGTSFPQLAEVGSAAEMAVLEEVFAPDIEEEANAYFQKIYTGQQSVDDVIAMLGQFRSAEDERKQRVFACMVHNLLDEYRFFPKYPDKELRITAVLFDQETLDKIHFTINNLSLANIDAKGKEVEAILRAEWYPWFAQYMVVKRASIEPNFHPLYFALLEKLNKSQLYKMILKATHDNIRVLLQSEKIKTNSGRMIAVLPFVSKVVEPVKMSKVFRPPNPWTTAILQLFAEIYSADDLKLNLKFEIEMLFKSMKDMSNTEVKISDMKPTINTLKNYQRAKVDNPDFAMDKSSVAAAKASGSSSESAPQSPRSAATSAATAKDSEEREAASAGPVNLQAFVQT
eukprot:jgi/Pico_ML_1/55906/g1520.t2